VVEWFALLFAVAAVMVLRRRQPELPRPFRTPLYPWVPLLFLVGTFAGLLAIVQGEIDRPVPNYSPLWGLLIAAAGFPVYWAWRHLKARAAAAMLVAGMSAVLGSGCGGARAANGPPVPASPVGGTLGWSDEFTGPRGALVDAGRWVAETGGHGRGDHEPGYQP